MTPKSKNIMRILAPLALVLVISLAGCGGNAGGNTSSGGIEQAAAPAVGVAPSVKTVKTGEEFDINIMIKAKDPVRAAGCSLSWSGAGKIECTGKIDEGGFFKVAGKTMMIPAAYNAGSGTKGQVAVSSLTEKGASGEGTLVVFHFKAVAPGQVDLKTSDVQVTDLTDKEISVTKYDGKVIVQ